MASCFLGCPRPRPRPSLPFSDMASPCSYPPYRFFLPITSQSTRLSLRHRSALRIVAQKPDFYKVVGTGVQTAKDFLDAGTKLIPESVPRPLAQAGVAALGIFAFSYLLQSLFSIALFILGIGGVGYYILVYLNKDDDQGGGGGSSKSSNADITLEEARRIMEKYK